MDTEYTCWFPASTPPVRNGVYQRKYPLGKRSSNWAAFEAGCLMEREACAKLADSMRDKTSRYADYLGDGGEAIRSRT
jgi:hypothetical protein